MYGWLLEAKESNRQKRVELFDNYEVGLDIYF